MWKTFYKKFSKKKSFQKRVYEKKVHEKNLQKVSHEKTNYPIISHELRIVKGAIEAAEAHKLVVIALFGYFSVLKNEYAVGILDG